jgi:hypothetical protein
VRVTTETSPQGHPDTVIRWRMPHSPAERTLPHLRTDARHSKGAKGEANQLRLETIVADWNTPLKHVWRARVVLLTEEGLGTSGIMRRTGTTFGDPPGEATRSTAATMAKAIGISVSSVQRIWRGAALQPHRVRQIKLSRDSEFVPKLRDIVGLYVDPPAHAIVLSVDEKSQIQALDSTQLGLPPKPGRCGTMTHHYKRNGATTLPPPKRSNARIIDAVRRGYEAGFDPLTGP